MEKENNKKPPSNINEELMMNIMVDGVKKGGLKEPATEELQIENTGSKELSPEKNIVREKHKSRKTAEAEYESAFFRKSDTNARDGKTVYIRPEFHEKLTRIIHVIGEDKISIYSYLDNLLNYHFEEYAQQITKSYNGKYKSI